ncbi:hypothetical protein SLS58_007180 [Diplodia intermedia]|uniref:Uncharacterized protein n=1 Tax=Diplodia intermedia TaxID=856260 RepID=A0ABR3TL96_9PEZI
MTRKKLRDFLAQADQPIDFRTKVSGKGKKASSSSHPHFSTDRSNKWPEVSGWSVWEEFSPDTIEMIMGSLLDAEFDFPEALPYGPDALLIAPNEPVFQFDIVRHNNVIVNVAIAVISEHYPNLVTRCWASGNSAQCNSDIGIPDFATIPLKLHSATEEAPNCVCPGDTKFYGKLVQFPYEPEEVEGDDWAMQCLRQVCHYAVHRRTRYFYLLTPEGAIIGRRSHSTTSGLAPEIVKVFWHASQEDLNVNTALLFQFIVAGLNHDVDHTYKSLQDEYGPMFRRFGP